MVCLFDSLGLVCFVLALESHLRVDGMDGWMARHYGEIILCFITFFHIGGEEEYSFYVWFYYGNPGSLYVLLSHCECI